MNTSAAATPGLAATTDIMRVTGYRLSSDELSAGLDVSSVRLTDMPVELVGELLRMRKCWQGAGALGFGGARLN